MTLSFGLLLGGILALAGLAVYIFAPRVGPNPIFGVRVGYAYASREVWDKTNRFGGGLIMIVGIFTAIVGLVLELLNVSRDIALYTLTGVMLSVLFAGVAWMILYARMLAHGTALARKLTPVRFRWTYLAPITITFVALVAVTLWFYPQLPIERMATHFGIDDQPNGRMTRDGFVFLFLGLAALFVLMNLIAIHVSTREPIFAFGRWGDKWFLTPERGLIFMGSVLALVNLIFIIVMLDVGWFNTHGAHLFPLGWLLVLIVPILVIVIGLFFILGRRADVSNSPPLAD